MGSPYGQTESALAMASFINQFGEIDEHKRVVLEIIFEELYGRKILPISNEEGQVSSSAVSYISGPNPPSD